MRILYIARHDQANSNDDEGSMAFCLEQFGHEVVKIDQWKAREGLDETGDVLLFHKWYDPRALVRFREQGVKLVFWWFDLISYPSDPSLANRCQERERWMNTITPLVDLGFLSDGDFAVRHPGKLVTLRQGADGRVAGRGIPIGPRIPLLFTGAVYNCGIGRHQFMGEMVRYGDKFKHVTHGVHGKDMADLIADADICLAPPEPATDRYWSNRVYNTLGFGGFLLHPFCEELAREYVDSKEVVFYRDSEDMHCKIQFYLSNPEARARISAAGLKRTLGQHLYWHRVRDLLWTVKERLGLGDAGVHSTAADSGR